MSKKWVKAKSNGTLYIDTSHPEWQKWFVGEIKRLSKYKIIKGRLVNTETGQIVAEQG